MSKYNALWNYIKRNDRQSINLSFEEIERIAGIAQFKLNVKSGLLKINLLHKWHEKDAA